MKKFLHFVVITSLMIFFSVSIISCKREIDGGGTKNNNDKKIGYLFYSSFIDEYNPKLFETFAKFKAEGVTDLIVDLRYNHGGSIGAATYLASLIAPKAAVQSKAVFSQLDFNAFLNGRYGDDRLYKLGEFNAAHSNPLNANLDLKNVYIIATDDSYSAAELLAFCLRPHMNVVHVGNETGGKFTASFTVHAFDRYNNRAATVYDSTRLTQSEKDSLRNWGMQPIVAIYSDKNNNNFSNAGKLIPDVRVTSRENDITAYKYLGDPSDYMISAALSKISGTNASAFQSPSLPRSVVAQPAKLYEGKNPMFSESVLWTPPVSAGNAQTNATAGMNIVSEFAYDGLLVFYRWSDYMKVKLPTSADNDPVAYFKSLLYPLDTQKGWSWITNDVSALLAEFAGEPVDFGWAFNLLWADASKSRIIGVVKYVYPNTPAANAGIGRGDMVTQINGTNITDVAGAAGDYRKLFGGEAINVAVESTTGNKTVNVVPIRISTNPVLKDTIYTVKK